MSAVLLIFIKLVTLVELGYAAERFPQVLYPEPEELNIVTMPASFKVLTSLVGSLSIDVNCFSTPTIPLISVFEGDQWYPLSMSLAAITPASLDEYGSKTVESVAEL